MSCSISKQQNGVLYFFLILITSYHIVTMFIKNITFEKERFLQISRTNVFFD